MTDPGPHPRLRIVFIAGSSRSGSTLLLRLLGQVPGVHPAGEMFDVWARGYLQNQLCGCGAPFRDCAFWREVTGRAFGCEPGGVPAERYEALRRSLVVRGQIARLFIPALRSGPYRERLRLYAGLFRRLYVAISEVSGATILVDSSKQPRHGWLLRELGGFDIHAVHLVRDSRAVAFSWGRVRRRPEIHWRAETMGQHSPLWSALDWDAVNLLVAGRQSSLASYSLVRYEDLVDRPGAVIGRLGRALGEIWSGPPVDALGRVQMGADHTASGNPARFATGTVSLREDDEWRRAMSRPQGRLVSALTAPLLHRYGYRLRPAPATRQER